MSRPIHAFSPVKTVAKVARARGFSLIEVNIAILVIGIGVLALLRLFPLGLHESTLSNASMLQTTAADYMLSRIQSQAQNVTTNWAVWQDRRRLIDHLTSDPLGGGVRFWADRNQELDKFPGDKDTTRYHLTIEPVGEEPPFFHYRVWVQVSERTRGTFENNPYFYTELIFHGHP